MHMCVVTIENLEFVICIFISYSIGYKLNIYMCIYRVVEVEEKDR